MEIEKDGKIYIITDGGKVWNVKISNEKYSVNTKVNKSDYETLDDLTDAIKANLIFA